MSGHVPDYISKGVMVLYKGKEVTVIDWYFTCPYVIGIKQHHPNDDVLMLKLKDIGDVPEKNVKPIKTS
jgi:hypothetical protein